MPRRHSQVAPSAAAAQSPSPSPFIESLRELVDLAVADPNFPGPGYQIGEEVIHRHGPASPEEEAAFKAMICFADTRVAGVVGGTRHISGTVNRQEDTQIFQVQRFCTPDGETWWDKGGGVTLNVWTSDLSVPPSSLQM